MLTETEAKTKWCPMARQVFQVEGVPLVGNSLAMPDKRIKHMMCIASACMMWREIREPGETLIEGIKRYRSEYGASLVAAKDYVEQHPEYRNSGPSTSGFCGLAGRP